MSLEVAKEDSDSETLLLEILKHRHFDFWKRKKETEYHRLRNPAVTTFSKDDNLLKVEKNALIQVSLVALHVVEDSCSQL